MAWRLAQTGKRVLLLERGDYLPRERENWDTKAVFVDARYQALETWYGADGKSFHPGLHYFVGGNSKVYGAVLLRLREKDFDQIRHADGFSPAWPLKYDTFEPYYQAAEELYHVHGLRGEDPTEPPAHKAYAYPPISHEPRIQQLFDGLKREGHAPFHLPVGILLDEENGAALPHSPCIRCNAFDGYPCLTNGKADAQVICVDPALLAHPNLTLMTNSLCRQAHHRRRADGAISGVEVVRDQERVSYRRISWWSPAAPCPPRCSCFVRRMRVIRRACQRFGSRRAKLHAPQQLGADGDVQDAESDQVSKDPGIERFLFRRPTIGSFRSGTFRWWAKQMGSHCAARVCPAFCNGFRRSHLIGSPQHSLDFWLTSEDLPLADNRIYYDGAKVRLDLTQTNTEAHERLQEQTAGSVRQAGPASAPLRALLVSRAKYSDRRNGASGRDPACLARIPTTSVLDTDCKAHGIDNLYVTDASFFPSIGAVNPTLTIIANALRVGDIIARRLGAATVALAPALSPPPKAKGAGQTSFKISQSGPRRRSRADSPRRATPSPCAVRSPASRNGRTKPQTAIAP